MSAKHSPKKVP